MPEPIDTISESIAGIGRLQENLTAITGMLDDQFDDLQTLFDHLQTGVIDISLLTPQEVGTLAACLIEAYSVRFIRRYQQVVIDEISIRN